MNIASIEDNIYDWLSALVPTVPFIWVYQDAEKPTSFVSMRHDAFSKLGLNGSKSSPDGANSVTVTRDTEFMLYITGYGDDGLEAVYSLSDFLELQQTKDALTALTNKLVFVTTEGGVRDTSAVIENHSEKRASLDMLLRFGNIVTYTSGIIETVNFTLQAKRDSDVVISKAISVEE